MSTPGAYQTWSEVLESGTVSPDQSDLLMQEILDDGNVVSILTDDLAMHRILSTIGESSESADMFVNNCLDKIHALKGQPTQVPEITTRQSDIVSRPNDARRVVAGRNTRAKLVIAAMAIGAAVLIGCFIVLWDAQSEMFRNTQKQQRDPDISETQQNESEPEVPSDKTIDNPSLVQGEEEELVLPDLKSIKPNREPENEMEIIDAVALLMVDEDATWESELSQGPVAAGQYKLEKGNAAFRFAGGEVVFMSAPSEINLLDSEKVELVAGQFLVDTINTSGSLALVSSRDLTLNQFEDAQIRILVDPRGSEVLLSSGNFSLNRVADLNEQPLEMKFDDLNRAFVNNSRQQLEEKEVVPVVVASGPKRYFGQMGLGEQKKTSTSPSEFQSLIKQHFEGTNKPPENLRRFHEMFEDIQRQFQDDPDSPSPESTNQFSLQRDLMMNMERARRLIQQHRERLKIPSGM